MFSFCSVSVETLEHAYAAQWRILVRCNGRGRIDGPSSRSSRECTYRAELDMESLVWTRGRNFPLNRLAERLRCPRCGSPYVRGLFQPPLKPAAKRGGARSPLRPVDLAFTTNGWRQGVLGLQPHVGAAHAVRGAEPLFSRPSPRHHDPQPDRAPDMDRRCE